MCEVLDRIENKGRREGRLEGRREGQLEGERKGKMETALNLRHMGMDAEGGWAGNRAETRFGP